MTWLGGWQSDMMTPVRRPSEPTDGIHGTERFRCGMLHWTAAPMREQLGMMLRLPLPCRLLPEVGALQGRPTGGAPHRWLWKGCRYEAR